jgi:hypothetical protein
MDIRKVGFGAVDWVFLTKDWDQWWVLMNKVMNLQIP